MDEFHYALSPRQQREPRATCVGCEDDLPISMITEDTHLCPICDRYGPEQEEAEFYNERYGHRRSHERPQ